MVWRAMLNDPSPYAQLIFGLLYVMTGSVIAILWDALMLDGELERWKVWLTVLAWPLVLLGIALWGALQVLMAAGRILVRR